MHVFIIPKQFGNPPGGLEINCWFPQCPDFLQFVTESARTEWEGLEEFKCSKQKRKFDLCQFTLRSRQLYGYLAETENVSKQLPRAASRFTFSTWRPCFLKNAEKKFKESQFSEHNHTKVERSVPLCIEEAHCKFKFYPLLRWLEKRWEYWTLVMCFASVTVRNLIVGCFYSTLFGNLFSVPEAKVRIAQQDTPILSCKLFTGDNNLIACQRAGLNWIQALTLLHDITNRALQLEVYWRATILVLSQTAIVSVRWQKFNF